jgi:hypothetical protein
MAEATSVVTQAESALSIPEGDFKIHIEDASASKALGIKATFPQKKYIVVERINEGLISAWNLNMDLCMEHPAEMQVKAGDSIVAINSVFGDSDLMLDEVVRAKSITLAIKRGQAVAGTAEGALMEPAASPMAEVRSDAITVTANSGKVASTSPEVAPPKLLDSGDSMLWNDKGKAMLKDLLAESLSMLLETNPAGQAATNERLQAENMAMKDLQAENVAMKEQLSHMQRQVDLLLGFLQKESGDQSVSQLSYKVRQLQYDREYDRTRMASSLEQLRREVSAALEKVGIGLVKSPDSDFEPSLVI